MPTSRVRLGDTGQEVTVEHPAGASPEEIKRLARQPQVQGRPLVKPDDPRLVKISPSQFLAEGAKRRAGDIGAMVGATVPWARGPAGLALRLGGAEMGQEIGDVAATGKVTPGYGAASQLVGEGVAKVAAPLLSPSTYRAYADRTARALGEKLKNLVPSWSQFPSTAKGVYEMAHGTGQRALSQEFETSMQAIKRQIPETYIVHVPETVEVAGRLEEMAKPRNARALIDDLPALRKVGGKPYRAALKALSEELPEGLSPEIDAARRTYRHGAGFIEFAEEGKFLYGEKYDPATAQQALDKFGKALIGRGMDQIRAIIRGPEPRTIETKHIGPWTKKIAGGVAGGAAASGAGLPHWAGYAPGALAAEALIPSDVYRHVPQSAGRRALGRAGTAVGAEGLREVARDLGFREKLPALTISPGQGPSTEDVDRQMLERREILERSQNPESWRKPSETPEQFLKRLGTP